jgi:hypothetical protein
MSVMAAKARSMCASAERAGSAPSTCPELLLVLVGHGVIDRG